MDRHSSNSHPAPPLEQNVSGGLTQRYLLPRGSAMYRYQMGGGYLILVMGQAQYAHISIPLPPTRIRHQMEEPRGKDNVDTCVI